MRVLTCLLRDVAVDPAQSHAHHDSNRTAEYARLVTLQPVSSRRTAVIIQRRRLLHLASGVAVLPIVLRTASAQIYPARSVRILVATTAGGATDLAARLVAQWLTDKLGQSFFVENRPGGNNNIGTEA